MNNYEPSIISLIDVGSYLPDNIVSADYFVQYTDPQAPIANSLFKAPRFRHYIAANESPADMAEQAVASIIARHGREILSEIDILIMHTALPETPFVGNGGDVAARLGIAPEWLIDLHNGGCAAFVYAMKLAGQLLVSTEARTALIVTVTNVAGQVYTQEQVRSKPQAVGPGDGAGAGLLVKCAQSPILGVEACHRPEFAGEMAVAADPPRKYWEAGSGQVHLAYPESMVEEVLARGNRMLPEAVHAVCDRIGIPPQELDFLVTSQPNRLYMKNWREALLLPHERHLDSYDECGNLFAASIPVTFDRAVAEGRISAGSIVMFAGFAHYGDLTAAAAVRWGGR